MTRRGFTVTELLVVMGIIMAIIATLVVGLTAAARSARRAHTDHLMNSMASAISRFKDEVGYLPPVIGVPSEVVTGAPSTAFNTRGWGRDLVPSPAITSGGAPPNHWVGWNAIERDTIQRYRSSTTPAEYLIGLGDRSEDGYGLILQNDGSLPPSGTPGSREQPTLGIRSPGSDGAWGAVLNPRTGFQPNGQFASRNLAANTVAGNAESSGFVKGKQFGPYVEVKDRDMIAALVGHQADGTPIVAKPGEGGYSDLAPKVIVDYFGKPIMYYRRGYVNADPRTTNDIWSLADVFALRPSEFPEGDALNGLPDGLNDPSTSRALSAAAFALLSFGPDQRWDPTTRRDNAGFNKDNMVRLGQ